MSTAPARVVLATRNQHKVGELRRILTAQRVGEGGVEVLGLDRFPTVGDIPETGVTFAENALIKAVEVARLTGLPAISDDSGLCVDVLGGAPGVFSARWSGTHGDDRANLRLLLAQLGDVPAEHRAASFRCAAAVALPDGTSRVVEGAMTGRLITVERGLNGFGYDPIFVADGLDRTNAELTPQEKDAISHRAKAFAALVPVLLELLEGPAGVGPAGR